jgi:hypothetical protein
LQCRSGVQFHEKRKRGNIFAVNGRQHTHRNAPTECDPSDGQKIGVEVWRCNLAPNGQIGLVLDDYGNWTLDASILDDSVCPLLPESIRYSQRMEFNIRSLSKPDSVQATIRPRFNGLAVVLVPRYGVVRAPQRVAGS